MRVRLSPAPLGPSLRADTEACRLRRRVAAQRSALERFVGGTAPRFAEMSPSGDRAARNSAEPHPQVSGPQPQNCTPPPTATRCCATLRARRRRLRRRVAGATLRARRRRLRRRVTPLSGRFCAIRTPRTRTFLCSSGPKDGHRKTKHGTVMSGAHELASRAHLRAMFAGNAARGEVSSGFRRHRASSARRCREARFPNELFACAGRVRFPPGAPIRIGSR